MKFVWVGILLGGFVMAPAHAGKYVGQKQLPLSRAFIPVGYDTDDNVEIMLLAELPNSCFKLGPLTTEVTDKREIKVSQTVYEFNGECHDGPIPIPQVASLGRLPSEGTYRLVDVNSKKSLGEVKVAWAADIGHGTDALLYPALTDAYIDWRSNSLKLRLSGVYSDDCQVIKKIAILPQKDVVVVLADVDHPEGVNCKKGLYPFEHEFEVNKEIPRKAFLLHVRSLGGKSINKLVFPPAT